MGSSDTDADSIGYASSSSGTTTPEDDVQVFHLGPTLQSVLAEKPKLIPREKPTVVTKHRNLSSAVKSVKKVAHALAMFKKKVSQPLCSLPLPGRKHYDIELHVGFQRCDDASPSPLRERFGKRMAIKSHPEGVRGSVPQES